MTSLSVNDLSNIVSAIGKDFEDYARRIHDKNLSASFFLNYREKSECAVSLRQLLNISNEFHLNIVVDAIWASIFHEDEDDHTSTPNIGSVLPFPKEGISLSGILEFVEICGGPAIFELLTTTEVCESYLKPLTFLKKESYCDVLKNKNSSFVGTASVFISHAWKFEFLHVLEALEYHFKDTPDIILWFDLFSNNQHSAPDLDFNWWSTTFKSAIQQFGHTVLILHPWSDPIPLTRAWCLFEIYCTASTNSRFEVAMSKGDRASFVKSILKNCQGEINRMLSVVDVERSEAWNPLDRERIFEAVRASIGFTAINKIVFEKLRDWVVATAVSALDDMGSSGSSVDDQAARGL